MSKAGWELERSRQRIVFAILDDFRARTVYGALVGAVMVVIDRTKGSVENDMLRALDFIEAGMPL